MADLDSFSKKDTDIIKGIAILAMILHHTYGNDPASSIFQMGNVSKITWLAATGKVCVALFTILSGYGLTKSYNKGFKKQKYYDVKFVLSHYIQFLSIFWTVLLAMAAIRLCEGEKIIEVYGSGAKRFFCFFIEILGLRTIFHTPSINTSWFVTAIIILYFLFPLIYRLVKKFPIISLFFSYIPWIIYIIKGDTNMHTDWWLFYLFSFALGIFISEKDLLDKQIQSERNIRNIILVIILFVLSFISRLIFALPADPVLAISIIEIEIYILRYIKPVKAFLEMFGRYSAYIWLIHMFIWFRFYISIYSGLLQYMIVFLVFCLLSGMALDGLRKELKLDNLVSKTRSKLLM
ncbi:MAG: acyltransferase family protein [Lachnospiraceae bacterium]|nr:acyltransferase family protein [Lachnospiraceae bacterium]